MKTTVSQTTGATQATPLVASCAVQPASKFTPAAALRAAKAFSERYFSAVETLVTYAPSHGTPISADALSTLKGHGSAVREKRHILALNRPTFHPDLETETGVGFNRAPQGIPYTMGGHAKRAAMLRSRIAVHSNGASPPGNDAHRKYAQALATGSPAYA